MPSEKQPIETAPKNGMAIIVGDPDCGEFVMAWDKEMQNPFFAPGVFGMWTALDKSFTWQDADGNGPTYWKELA